jgi:hypothetical protein
MSLHVVHLPVLKQAVFDDSRTVDLLGRSSLFDRVNEQRPEGTPGQFTNYSSPMNLAHLHDITKQRH